MSKVLCGPKKAKINCKVSHALNIHLFFFCPRNKVYSSSVHNIDIQRLTVKKH